MSHDNPWQVLGLSENATAEVTGFPIAGLELIATPTPYAGAKSTTRLR